MTRTRGQLILAVNGSGVGLNVVAGDQYVVDVLPARMFAPEFRHRGVAPQVLSRAVDDSGTVTSVLVPCFFNLLSPLFDFVYGFVGFKVPRADDGVVEPRPQVPETPMAPTVPAQGG